MKKVELNVTDKDIKILKKESKYAKFAKVREKARALYLRAIGKTEKEIREKTDLSVTTIMSYIHDFNENGIDSIYRTKHKGQPSKMNKHIDEIKAEFKKNPPQTIDEAAIRIKEKTGISRTYNSVRLFLLKGGFLTRKQEVYQQKQTKKNNKNS